jgi:hypothetical protein
LVLSRSVMRGGLLTSPGRILDRLSERTYVMDSLTTLSGVWLGMNFGSVGYFAGFQIPFYVFVAQAEFGT